MHVPCLPSTWAFRALCSMCHLISPIKHSPSTIVQQKKGNYIHDIHSYSIFNIPAIIIPYSTEITPTGGSWSIIFNRRSLPLSLSLVRRPQPEEPNERQLLQSHLKNLPLKKHLHEQQEVKLKLKSQLRKRHQLEAVKRPSQLLQLQLHQRGELRGRHLLTPLRRVQRKRLKVSRGTC